MQFSPNSCLFTLWQEHSAPMLHTSALWPAFSEANIQEFLAGDADRPKASRMLDEAAVNKYRGQIQAFIDMVTAHPDDTYACKAAYLDFETERLANLDLVLAEDQAEIEKYNDRLYGLTADMHQADILTYLKAFVQNLQPKAPGTAAARDRLLEFWADVPADAAPIEQLCREFDEIRLHLRPYVERRFAFVPELMAPFAPTGRLNSQQVQDLLDDSLGRILGDRRDNWTAIVKDGAPNVFIDNDTKCIVVPAGRLYEPGKISALIIHEIGAHVTRAVNGLYSLEKLASCGMAGYGAAEESFGALLGATSDHTYDPTSSFISFAVIDFSERGGAKTFRQIHALTKDFMMCRANPKPDRYEAVERDQARLSFARVIRPSRKGTGAIIERSTTKYWRGLTMLKSYFDEHGFTEASVKRFLLGKYDCMNNYQYQLITGHIAP